MELRVSKCPACGNNHFAISRLVCTSCGTAVEGRFSVSRLATLSDDNIAFVETFLACRGNIKEVERELGISYPTVRSRLDRVVAQLGLADEAVVRKNRTEILEALDRNEMSPEEAVGALKALRDQ